MSRTLLLAIDAGNTNTSVALCHGREPRARFEIPTSAGGSAAGLAARLRDALGASGIDAGDVAACLVASVVPPADAALAAAISDVAGVPARFVDHRTPGIPPLAVAAPETLGADRIVNAVAAVARVGAPCIVVDLGTATTFTAVAPDGSLAGGAIAPGMGTSAEALFARGARLPRVPLAAPERALGGGTVAALQSGIVLGHVAMVEGLLARIGAELGGAPRVLATGGLGGLVAPHVRAVESVVTDLTLEGLCLLHERISREP